ncbi:MAG: aminoglycoside phosphotransferase family protein [Nanoarchaeota archaeon]
MDIIYFDKSRYESVLGKREIESLFPLGGGFAHIIVNLSFNEGPGLVFKFNPPNESKFTFHGLDLNTEFKFLSRCANAGYINVPRPIMLDESCSIFPTPFIVLEKIEGDNLDKRIAEERSTEGKKRLISRGIDELIRLHEIDPGEVNFIPRYRNFAEYRMDRLKKLTKDIKVNRLILESVEELQRRFPIEEESRVIHNDFSFYQMIYSKGAIYCLDFDSVCMGDPTWDILWMFKGREEWFGFNDETEFIVNSYEEKSKRTLKNLGFYGLYSCVKAYLITMTVKQAAAEDHPLRSILKYEKMIEEDLKKKISSS